eukprot:gnl/TRDRNA2_/TRDRNA2_189889_c0_seq1.p1 gnl/TRDRNA2_/TRDRNA2_189889_c0~~gnl/TRDRNA2_/TRDRNA2_189889_c0_seq1.p1  ORF type:complete len:240 (-),score=62.70 gnl/TRDRNA2_/TRDRNA2_189889_c0_seq1:82-801(-)
MTTYMRAEPLVPRRRLTAAQVVAAVAVPATMRMSACRRPAHRCAVSWWLPLLAVFGALQSVSATMRLPEEFNVYEDFEEKEKWRRAQWEVRCDFCKVTVANTYENIGDNFNEDHIYNHIETLCDKEALYNQYEIKLDDSPIESDEPQLMLQHVLVKATENSTRTEHNKKWQTHAMKELCDNIIRPSDDEIKDHIMKALRKSRQKKADSAGLGDRSLLAVGACEKIKLCKKQKPKKGGEL